MSAAKKQQRSTPRRDDDSDDDDDDDVVAMVDQDDKEFDLYFQALVQYQTEHDGDTRVHKDYSTRDKHHLPLGEWVALIRKRYRDIPSSQRTPAFQSQVKRLDDIGMIWDCSAYMWEQNFQALQQLQQQVGKDKLQESLRPGNKLRAWTIYQVKRYHTGRLSEEDAERLRQLGVKVDDDDGVGPIRVSSRRGGGADKSSPNVARMPHGEPTEQHGGGTPRNAELESFLKDPLSSSSKKNKTKKRHRGDDVFDAVNKSGRRYPKVARKEATSAKKPPPQAPADEKEQPQGGSFLFNLFQAVSEKVGNPFRSLWAKQPEPQAPPS